MPWPFVEQGEERDGRAAPWAARPATCALVCCGRAVALLGNGCRALLADGAGSRAIGSAVTRGGGGRWVGLQNARMRKLLGWLAGWLAPCLAE
eukprot:360295-Chlamydomonas_euryale.AAC.5